MRRQLLVNTFLQEPVFDSLRPSPERNIPLKPESDSSFRNQGNTFPPELESPRSPRWLPRRFRVKLESDSLRL